MKLTIEIEDTDRRKVIKFIMPHNNLGPHYWSSLDVIWKFHAKAKYILEDYFIGCKIDILTEKICMKEGEVEISFTFQWIDWCGQIKYK